MKTYSETRNKPPFNWNEALKKDCSEMSIKEANKLSELSAKWTTCACGNQCVIIPRNAEGDPKDSELYDLGVDFDKEIINMGYFIGAKNFKLANQSKLYAIEILKKIEERSAFLINEINKKK